MRLQTKSQDHERAGPRREKRQRLRIHASAAWLLALALCIGVVAGCDSTDTVTAANEELRTKPESAPESVDGPTTSDAPSFLPGEFQPPSAFGCSDPGTGYSGAQYQVTKYGINELGSNKQTVEEIQGDILLNNCTESDYLDFLDDEKQRIANQCNVTGLATAAILSVLAGRLEGGFSIAAALASAAGNGGVTLKVCSQLKSHIDDRRDQLNSLDCGGSGKAARVLYENLNAGTTMVVDEMGVQCQPDPGDPNYGGMPDQLDDIQEDGEYTLPDVNITGSVGADLYRGEDTTQTVTLRLEYGDKYLSDDQLRALNARLPIDNISVIYDEGNTTDHEFVSVPSDIDIRAGYDEELDVTLNCPSEEFEGSASIHLMMAAHNKGTIQATVDCSYLPVTYDQANYTDYWDRSAIDLDWGEATGEGDWGEALFELDIGYARPADIERVEIVNTHQDDADFSDFVTVPDPSFTLKTDQPKNIELKFECPTHEEYQRLGQLESYYEGQFAIRLYGQNDARLSESQTFTFTCNSKVYVPSGLGIARDNWGWNDACPQNMDGGLGFLVDTDQGQYEGEMSDHLGTDTFQGSWTFTPSSDGIWIGDYWTQTDETVELSSVTVTFDTGVQYTGSAMSHSVFDVGGNYSPTIEDAPGCWRGQVKQEGMYIREITTL